MFSRKGAKPQRKSAFRFALGAFAPLREAKFKRTQRHTNITGHSNVEMIARIA
jgi:hypothetical protein